MKFIIGIGNPGHQYEETRHNIGFRVVDELLKRPAFTSRVAKWTPDQDLKAFVAKLNDNTLLVKSQLFVNNTGGTVSAIQARNPELKPFDCLLVCDDVNLSFGKLRLRESGSAGGHHGLESVIMDRNTDEFPRLRIGVGNEGLPKDLSSFVLEEFSAEEKKELGKVLEKAVLICEAWEKEGFGSAQGCLSRYQSAKEKGE